MYSQIRGPNFSPDETEHCIVIDIPTDDQIPVQPGDVVGFYSDYLDDNDDDGVQLDESMTDVTAYYRERSKIDPPTLSSCMLIAGPNNIDSTITAAPVITVVVGKLLMHQHVPFCTIKQQGQTQALGVHTWALHWHAYIAVQWLQWQKAVKQSRICVNRRKRLGYIISAIRKGSCMHSNICS